MKVVSCFVDEVVPLDFLVGVDEAFSLHFISEQAGFARFFVLVEQGRDHSHGKDVIDKFKETFFLDMCISNQKHNRLFDKQAE